MKRLLVVTIGILSMSLSTASWSYDATKAKEYEALFSPAMGAKVGKALHFVSAKAFVNDIQAGKEMLAIDVRSPAETSVFALTIPNSVEIPVNEIFQAENLKRIPTDKPVMIMCKSGARATAVGTALRHIGFDNVYIVKGGFKAVANAVGPAVKHKKAK